MSSRPDLERVAEVPPKGKRKKDAPLVVMNQPRKKTNVAQQEQVWIDICKAFRDANLGECVPHPETGETMLQFESESAAEKFFEKQAKEKRDFLVAGAEIKEGKVNIIGPYFLGCNGKFLKANKLEDIEEQLKKDPESNKAGTPENKALLDVRATLTMMRQQTSKGAVDELRRQQKSSQGNDPVADDDNVDDSRPSIS